MDSKDLKKEWNPRTKKRLYISAHIDTFKEWPISIGTISGLLMTRAKDLKCHNPRLGLATKARVCKGALPKVSLGVPLHAPESARK